MSMGGGNERFIAVPVRVMAAGWGGDIVRWTDPTACIGWPSEPMRQELDSLEQRAWPFKRN